MSLPCRLDIFRFRRTKKGLLAITNKSFLYQAFTVKMHNLLNGHFPILVYGVIACCQRHGISKRRVHSQYTKGSPITGGRKTKKTTYQCTNSFPPQLRLYLGQLHCSCRRIRLNTVLSEKKGTRKKSKVNVRSR